MRKPCRNAFVLFAKTAGDLRANFLVFCVTSHEDLRFGTKPEDQELWKKWNISSTTEFWMNYVHPTEGERVARPLTNVECPGNIQRVNGFCGATPEERINDEVFQNFIYFLKKL